MKIQTKKTLQNKRNTRSLVFHGFLLLLTLFSFHKNAVAHPGYFGTAFHAHSLEQAKAIAQRENKIIFLYAGRDDRGWLHFRWPKKDSNALIDVLIRESVIVEHNLAKKPLQLDEAAVNEPAIYLVNDNGNILKRFPNGTSDKQLYKALTKLVTSEEGFQRIENAVNNNLNPSFNLERYAAALAMAGKNTKALSNYEKALADAIDEVSLSAKSRRPHIIAAIIRMAKQDKNAKEVLHRQRQYAAGKLALKPSLGALAKDIATIDKFLGMENKSVELFQELPARSRARAGLFDTISPRLAEEKRYQQMLDLVDPIAAFDGEVTLYERNRILKPTSAERSSERGSRKFVINRSMELIEALAATQDDATCLKLIKKLQHFDSSETTNEQIRQSLARAKRKDFKF